MSKKFLPNRTAHDLRLNMSLKFIWHNHFKRLQAVKCSIMNYIHTHKYYYYVLQLKQLNNLTKLNFYDHFSF